MKRVQESNGYKEGIAKVRIGEKRVEVLFKKMKIDKELVELDKDDERAGPYRIDRSECPPYIDVVQAGEWYVVLNGEEDGISGIRPVRAMAKAKFLRFAAKEGEIPTPKSHAAGTRTKRDGSTFQGGAYQSMTAILTLLNAEYKGMEVPAWMIYPFADDGNGYVCIKGGGSAVDLVESFMDVNGVLDIDIKYSDNILPKLQDRILRHGATFGVTLKNGYIDRDGGYWELPDEDHNEVNDDDDVDDEPFEADEPEDDLDDDTPIEDLEEDEEAVL